MDTPKLTDAEAYQIIMQIVTSCTIKISDMKHVEAALDILEARLAHQESPVKEVK